MKIDLFILPIQTQLLNKLPKYSTNLVTSTLHDLLVCLLDRTALSLLRPVPVWGNNKLKSPSLHIYKS